MATINVNMSLDKYTKEPSTITVPNSIISGNSIKITFKLIPGDPLDGIIDTSITPSPGPNYILYHGAGMVGELATITNTVVSGTTLTLTYDVKSSGTIESTFVYLKRGGSANIPYAQKLRLTFQETQPDTGNIYMCNGCTPLGISPRCIEACKDFKAISIVPNGDNYAVVDEASCITCGDCLDVCPMYAIYIEDGLCKIANNVPKMDRSIFLENPVFMAQKLNEVTNPTINIDLSSCKIKFYVRYKNDPFSLTGDFTLDGSDNNSVVQNNAPDRYNYALRFVTKSVSGKEKTYNIYRDPLNRFFELQFNDLTSDLEKVTNEAIEIFPSSDSGDAKYKITLNVKRASRTKLAGNNLKQIMSAINNNSPNANIQASSPKYIYYNSNGTLKSNSQFLNLIVPEFVNNLPSPIEDPNKLAEFLLNDRRLSYFKDYGNTSPVGEVRITPNTPQVADKLDPLWDNYIKLKPDEKINNKNYVYLEDYKVYRMQTAEMYIQMWSELDSYEPTNQPEPIYAYDPLGYYLISDSVSSGSSINRAQLCETNYYLRHGAMDWKSNGGLQYLFPPDNYRIMIDPKFVLPYSYTKAKYKWNVRGYDEYYRSIDAYSYLEYGQKQWEDDKLWSMQNFSLTIRNVHIPGDYKRIPEDVPTSSRLFNFNLIDRVRYNTNGFILPANEMHIILPDEAGSRHDLVLIDSIYCEFTHLWDKKKHTYYQDHVGDHTTNSWSNVPLNNPNEATWANLEVMNVINTLKRYRIRPNDIYMDNNKAYGDFAYSYGKIKINLRSSLYPNQKSQFTMIKQLQSGEGLKFSTYPSGGNKTIVNALNKNGEITLRLKYYFSTSIYGSSGSIHEPQGSEVKFDRREITELDSTQEMVFSVSMITDNAKFTDEDFVISCSKEYSGDNFFDMKLSKLSTSTYGNDDYKLTINDLFIPGEGPHGPYENPDIDGVYPYLFNFYVKERDVDTGKTTGEKCKLVTSDKGGYRIKIVFDVFERHRTGTYTNPGRYTPYEPVLYWPNPMEPSLDNY